MIIFHNFITLASFKSQDLPFAHFQPRFIDVFASMSRRRTLNLACCELGVPSRVERCSRCSTAGPVLRGQLKQMSVIVQMEVLSVSFCPSDGCEGHSLLVVSQNGLSLSLASLFSGICRLRRFLSYVHVNCDTWRHRSEEKLVLNTRPAEFTLTQSCCCARVPFLGQV